jgi:hypothetical protein
MNGLLPVICCAAGAGLVGGALIFYRLRHKLPRRRLLAFAALPMLLAGVVALTPFVRSAFKSKPLRDWQVLAERRATAEELRLLRESFPGMTGQVDREVYHHLGRFKLAITGFENEAEAKAFWEFRKNQTRHLHLYNGNTHMELYGYFSELSAMIWAEFKPDPLIRRCAALAANGIPLRWIVRQEPEPGQEYIGLFYKTLTSFGYLELLLAEHQPAGSGEWLQIPEESDGWMLYVPFPDAPNMLETLQEIMTKPIPRNFCPPEILSL